MRVLICGGRDYANRAQFEYAMYVFHTRKPVTAVIEGGARGADRLAREWAQRLGLEVLTFDADWDRWGKSAGYRRNQQMLDEGRPDMVVAFPGGRGTANMIDLALRAKVKVWEPFRERVC